MDMILIKILAAFLALSQVTTRPDAIKTRFDPAGDRAEVTEILRDGCGHFRKAFDVELIDLDDLIKTPARPRSWQAGNIAEPNGAYLLLRAGVSLKKPW